MMIVKSVTLISIIAISSAVAAIHPNHVSLAEIEYNRKTECFEVSLCVWPEDLEKVISKIENADSALNLNEELIQKHIPGYLQNRFLLVSDNNNTLALKIRWVGCEVTAKKAWLYFECKNKSGGSQFRLTNKIFHEINEDQVNHAKFRLDKSIVWHQLTPKSESCSIEIVN